MPYDVWQTCVFVPGVSSEDCASWVQAWGSIGAILAAIAVGYGQSWRQERSAREAQRKISAEKYLLIHAQLAQVEAACDHLIDQIEMAREPRWNDLLQELTAAQDSLSAIPRLELLDGELASRLGTVDIALRRLRVALELASKSGLDDARRQLLRTLWEQCRTVLRAAAAWAVARRAEASTASDIAERRRSRERADEVAAKLEKAVQSARAERQRPGGH